VTELVPVVRLSATAVAVAKHRVFQPWLANYPSQHTQDAYARDALLWEAWCLTNGVDLLHPLPAHVTLWASHRREQGDSNTTVVRRVSSVLTFYKWARHERITDANPEPFRRPKINRDDAEVLGLTREEYHRVCQHAGTARNLALITLLGQCGLRIYEALSTTFEDIREQGGHRTVQVIGKGERPRTVPMPP
jgi:integrase/recombinase XerD